MRKNIDKIIKINVLYIEPDIELLIGDKKLQERSTYYILQEFARSALLERMYIISNPQIEKVVNKWGNFSMEEMDTLFPKMMGTGF